MTKKNKNSEFHKNEKAFQIDNIDVDKILVSKKEACGKDNSLIYFIGCNHNDVIRPLCLGLLQMTPYLKKFNENAKMSCRVNNK